MHHDIEALRQRADTVRSTIGKSCDRDIIKGALADVGTIFTEASVIQRKLDDCDLDYNNKVDRPALESLIAEAELLERGVLHILNTRSAH